MVFRKKPYWLIVGLFFVAVGIILHTLYIYSVPFIDQGFNLLGIIGFMLYGGDDVSPLSGMIAVAIACIIILWIYFFIGAMIGFLAEKIKYHKTFLIAVFAIMAALFGLRYSQLANAHNTQQHAGLTLQDCAKISAPIERNDCYADTYQNFPPNPSVCNKLNVFDRVSCAHYVGQKSADKDLCNELKLPNDYQSCIAGVAQNKQDMNICNLVKDPSAISRCIKTAQDYSALK